MINNTTLVGRMTKNPELRHTNSGIAVTSFSLAVERNYKNAQGERETDFINCQSWRGTAETIANLGVKGALIGVTGAIQTRNYQNKQNQTVYITEVIVDNFQMLEPKSVTDERRAQAGQQNNYSGQSNNNYQNNQQNSQNNYNNNQNSTQNNFNNNQQRNDPLDNNNVSQVDDDDLPF